MICLDTNTLIRFFTNDIPEKSQKVKKLLAFEGKIFIPDVVFPEIEYILIKKYNQSRKEIIQIFKFLSSNKNIILTRQIKSAIEIYNKTKLDMADCCICACSLDGKLASFDEGLLKAPGIKSYW
ncbi:hypothetical protein COV53_05210 [Candidatus Gottesmanbacteria bacterium CG11_big_fil_rev_8_21_14_0_20_37_11]|uniref:PIN domain-containing protein n=3 Tax=Candidatus Gottesmaniibacteriota TaxID=1752720 RepID=A0A2M7RQ69_9BACT|nr:MAG: hypothetical protein AUJ73_04365 [Candidatus Gottesmanbacteria bacterium CG1_02_37_22]PIR08021.1 MAG: hypothetical protein COV53_05210 [Candidatus Gottesmanbacteria bacterium CG11_big_fil_rev_8_21_14_0_20_37_11]PIZ02169.1 MAG: hypothetical protein COY59_06265 [Candidatus Gottesmanbacteria bacterium CG_4_10_14_0_8_um_filter_37_24]